MGNLYLVRHGQASFGADDYDQLSELGRKQAVRLGEYWRERGMHFDAVITGTLKRHLQTWEGIAEGLGMDPGSLRYTSLADTVHESRQQAAMQEANAASQTSQLPLALKWPGLNEYDSKAVIAAIHPGKLQKADTPELYRHYFRLLREGLGAWMQGRTSPVGMPVYADFLAGVTTALDHVRSKHHGAHVLAVSSGGPISTAVGHVLGTSAQTTVELNLRIRNTSITEFAFTPKRHMLMTYNTLPHLDLPVYKDWVTYS